MSDMDSAWLEDFLVLTDCLNFSRAAEIRHMTQSAMSRRIKSLEDWLGAPLFYRETHRLSLTPAGERFKSSAFDLVRRLKDARDQAHEAADMSQSAIRFATTHFLSLSFFPKLVQREGHDTAIGAIHLMADNMQACERLMLRGQAQFLLCHHHAAAANPLGARDFRSLTVGHDTVIPVSAPRGASGAPLHALPGTADKPVSTLSYGDSSGIGRILSAVQLAQPQDSWLSPVFTSHAATVIRAMARDGQGMAFLPHNMVEDDLKSGNLVRAGDPEWDVEIEIRLFRPRARQSSAAERFWAWLQENFADHYASVA
jgi:DNA-binding transcriptional LysR family regulator